MQVKQVYQYVNNIAKQILGESAVAIVDNKGIVDFGTTVLDTNRVDNYVRSCLDVIGKQLFVDRPYTGSVPSLLKQSWEYGSVLEKFQCEPFEAIENPKWELQDNTSYDTNIFYKPTVSVKFYNSKNTYMIPVSLAYDQVKESLLGESQMSKFFSMIMTMVENSMTLRINSLAMNALNSAIGEVIHGDLTGVRAIDLLGEYNTEHPSATIGTAKEAIRTPEFIRFAILRLGLTKGRLAKMSKLFNGGGKMRHTPEDKLHTVLLDEFAKAVGVYLENGNGQFKTEYIALPQAETVSYWQGSGTTYDFDDCSKIHLYTKDNTELEQGGIIGVMFDDEAIQVCNERRNTTSKFNEVGEFYNNWFKFDCSYFVDYDNENIVVFYLQDSED